jgi:hypothetical protein
MVENTASAGYTSATLKPSWTYWNYSHKNIFIIFQNLLFVTSQYFPAMCIYMEMYNNNNNTNIEMT